MPRRLVALLLAVLPLCGIAADATSHYAGLPGGSFRTALRYEDATGEARVAPFALMRTPVTNAEFLAFVQRHPEWRRDRVPAVFAESRYLSHWQSATRLGPNALPQQPVAAAMAKLLATEMAESVCRNAIQILGSYGYSSEYPVERLYRDARLMTIGGVQARCSGC